MKRLIKTNNKYIIGMIYLPPMPGHVNYYDRKSTLDIVMQDVALYHQRGITNVLIENEFDKPHKILATNEIVEEMSYITKKIVQRFQTLSVGVEFLLNDPKASLLIAKNAGADFIRTDYFVDEMRRDDLGITMDINPSEVVRYRHEIGADDIHILADVQVKYATMIKPKSIAQSIKEAQKEGASSAIISATMTGEEVSLLDVIESRKSSKLPILIGSGLNLSNAAILLPHVCGAIIGTAFLTDKGRVDPSKVKAFLKEFKCLKLS